MQKDRSQTRTVTVTVDAQDPSGAGAIHAFGKKILVTGIIAGERVALHIKDPREIYPEAEIRRIVARSPHRVDPRCPVFGRCGGCTLQMLAYPEQLKWKRRVVKEAIGKMLEDRSVLVRPTIGMKDPWLYRNKVQYPVGRDGRFPIIGFYAPVSYRIVTNRGCPIQHPEADLLKETLLAHLKEHRIEPYDERTGDGLVRTLMTRKGFATGQVVCILVLNGRTLPAMEDFVAAARAAVPALTGVVVNVNTKKGRVILGRENRVVWGSGTLTDTLLGHTFEISPNSFYQVNHAQAEALYRAALELAAIEKKDVVFDLYAGAGTITIPAAALAKEAWGVELSPEAVADAERNAKRNGMENARFVAGDVIRETSRLLDKKVRPDIVILDPPRAGCDKPLLLMLAAARPKRIVYVSCDPRTLARDLGILELHGYRVAEVQPVDLFPHTGHIEAVALLEPMGKKAAHK
ncbi:MAG TPA: 23S rRNA (uracil(1939)-C(5))-methyltransferase RlmD [bacterium]|nr:23S rRNA (uracil(1939)-C(5))-methyltransferase RlmD [bacterium]